MTIQEKQRKIVEEFSYLDEWMDKYEYLIELGRQLETLPEEAKNRKTSSRLPIPRVAGCKTYGRKACLCGR